MSLSTKFSLPTILAFASIYIIWGSTFLAISFALEGFPPFVLSGLRFFIAGLILFSWRKVKGESSNLFSNWKKNAITGILILTGGTGLVAWGEQYVSSTEAAIAIATGPFWFIALDKKNWRYYFTNKTIVSGLIIGFIGLILFLQGSVTKSGVTADANFKILAFIVLALSSIAWVLGSLYSKKNPGSQTTFMNIAQQLVVAGIASFFIATLRGEWLAFSFAAVPLQAWSGLIFLIFFGSIIAYLSYIWLLSLKEAVVVSTHTYINPIVAVFAGWLIAGEYISGLQFVGLGIILSGVVLTNASKYIIEKRKQVRIRRINQVLSRMVNPYKYITQ